VQEEGLEAIAPAESISEQVANQTTSALLRNAKEFRKEMRANERSIEEVRNCLKESGKFRGLVAEGAIQQSALSIVEDVMGREQTLVNLSSIRSQSTYHYQHAVDTTVTVLMLANRFAYNRQELEEIAIGSLLMDTGYLVMPERLVNNVGRLSFEEFNLIKEHPTFGFAILKENPRIPLVSTHIAFQHHEQQDGGGYPRHLKGNNEPPLRHSAPPVQGTIHRFSEIVAVADTYVRLSCPRPGMPLRSPEEVIHILLKAAGGQLNRAIVSTLIDMIPIYPVGSRVVVSMDRKGRYTGWHGVVARCDKASADKPLILLFQDRFRQKITPIELNLAEDDGIELRFVPIY